MVSEAAQRFIERRYAERQPEPPLAESRRNWETEARAHVLPDGARYSPVIAGGIASEWIDTPGARQDRVFLLLHGGGYVSGSPITHRKLGGHLGIATGMRVLVPDYRLAPEHPFPAGVKDALLAYGWLISEGGLQPQDIVVGGDSAGGGLTLSLLLALREAKAQMPRAAVLLSPWTDLTVSSPSYAVQQERDPFITEEGLRDAGLKYAGQRDPADPMASPLFADLSGLPPLLIHVGGDEVMLDDSRLLAERATAAGVAVTYREWPGLWHVFHGECPDIPEAVEAMREIGTFVRTQFDGSPA